MLDRYFGGESDIQSFTVHCPSSVVHSNPPQDATQALELAGQEYRRALAGRDWEVIIASAGLAGTAD